MTLKVRSNNAISGGCKIKFQWVHARYKQHWKIKDRANEPWDMCVLLCAVRQVDKDTRHETSHIAHFFLCRHLNHEGTAGEGERLELLRTHTMQSCLF